MIRRVMLDFETFGPAPDGAIVQLGAVKFNIAGECIGPPLTRNIDAKDAQQNGAKIGAQTMYWWLEQSEGARLSIGTTYGLGAVFEKDALNDLNDFLKGADEIWSHATFDFVILVAALERLGIKKQFHYKAARDIRTLVALTDVNAAAEPRMGLHHNALDDAIYQVGYVSKALRALGVTK